MDNQPVVTPSPRGASPARPPSGCLDSILVFSLSVWSLALSVASVGLAWVWEQSLFDGSLPLPDLRWLFTLVFGLAVFLPAFITWLLMKTSLRRGYYLAFALAGLFALLMAPARLAGITAWLEAVLGLILSALLFVLVNPARRMRPAAGAWPVGGWRGWGLALLVAAVLGLPWLAWGAFGSLWDILLALAAALLFGLAAAQILEVIVSPGGAIDPDGRPASIWTDGITTALVLLVMLAGLGVNGSQNLLALALPPLGWALVALYTRWSDPGGRERSNRPVIALLAGLAAFWPLALVDPDELALVISSGTGELTQWANTAAFTGLSLAILISLVLIFTRPREGQPERSAAGPIAAALAWAAALAVYLIVGQPGLYGERLFVIFTQQADLSAASQIADYPARRAAVYQELVQVANDSQSGVRAALDRFAIPYTPYYLQNAMEVQGGPLVRLWLNSRPEVDRVLDSPRLRPLPQEVPITTGIPEPPSGPLWNLEMIGAYRVHDELGVTGQGILVGQSDSGAQGDHPELASSYRGRAGQDDYNWFDPWYASASPTDIGGHGTHTLATVLGQNTGVAPGAEWIGCVNLGRNLGNPALYLDCMQFMLAPFPQGGDPLADGRPDQGAHVLNNSWGCPVVEGCDPTSLQSAVDALRAAGVFVVASAGNEGSPETCATLKSPLALYDSVYSVGAVDESGQLAPFSSVGPVDVDGSGRVKPDISAPGVFIYSAYPGGTYSEASGTSMAGPHVAGVVALIWSANPTLIGDIDATEDILNRSATPYTGSLPACIPPGSPNPAAGYGILNAYEAVRLAQEGQ